MPNPEENDMLDRWRGQLNEPQQRRLRVTCRYIDDLLSEIEHALHSSASTSPFPRYVVDVTPPQAQEIEDRIGRLRDELLRVLAWQHLSPERPDIPVTRSILTDLSYIDNALEELKPRYLRGCGPVPLDAIDDLNASIHGLQAIVHEMTQYIRSQATEAST